MTENNHQNGRRLGGHPNDPRLRQSVSNSVTAVPVCRDFVRGSCNKFHWCKYRHEWDIKEIIENDILKFCHDYQNNRGQCTMPKCSFLHASSEEEELFKTFGQIPQALAERGATMMVPTPVERTLTVNAYKSDTAFAPPPPPPPAVNIYAAPPPTTSIVGATPSNVVYTAPAAAILPMTQMLPPPPPPPPTPISSSGSTSVPVSISTAAVSNDTTFQSPPVLFPMFDASQPPPPLPAHIQEKGKHKLMDAIEAGPSKIRKPDQSKTSSGYCNICVQRQLRISMYKKDIEKLLTEDEQRNLAFQKKLQKLERAKELIRSRVSNKLYQFLEKYIEGVPDGFQANVLSQFKQASTTTSTQFLLQLMKLMARNISDNSLSLEESLLSALIMGNPARRASVLEDPPVAPAGDLLQEITNALAGSTPAAPAPAPVQPAPAPASAPTPAPAPAPAPTPAPAPAAMTAPAPPLYGGEWARGPPPGFPPPGVPPPGYNSAAPPPPTRFPPHHHYFPYHQ